MATPAPPPVKLQPLFCPNCGGPVQLRGFASTLTAVCPGCATVLDTSTPAVHILHQFEERQIRKPSIPLGTRGKFDNTTYEVTGFQVRGTEEDGETFEWSEYVLFNPYKGFLYLTEYEGHWNLVRPVHALPHREAGSGRPSVTWKGRKYQHFETAEAATLFVLGEFPWRVELGETVEVEDFNSPPYVLSAERTAGETTWSEGEYLEGARVWEVLGLKATPPPPPQGVYLNQPAPPQGIGSAVRLCAVLELALLVVWLAFYATDRRETAYDEKRQFTQTQSGEASYVTPVFELKGRTSNVEIRTTTDLDNHWIYFNYALIENDTGHAYDFGREVSYYHGSDSDGSWDEGGRNDSVMIPAVPPGHYYLRVEPEAEADSPPVSYEVVVRRDVPSVTFFVIAALLIPLPAVAITWRKFTFERQRAQQSDYASGGDN